MDKWIEFLVAVTAAYGIGLAVGVFWRIRALSLVALCTGVAGLLCVPLLITRSAGLRCVMAIVAFELVGKIVDYYRVNVRRPGPFSGYPGYLRCLNPFPFMMLTCVQRGRRPLPDVRPATEWIRLLLSLAVMTVAILCFLMSFQLQAARTCFAVDHLVKMLCFILTVDALSQAVRGVERLTGHEVIPLLEYSSLARTPADFWRRYNRRVGTWLYRFVFVPAGGRAHKARAVLITFFVNGLIHEYVFGIGQGRIDGYQLTFFMLQGLGVLASPALEALGRRCGRAGPPLVRLTTLAFLLATSVFFFASLSRSFPMFYGAPVPLP